VGVARIKNYFSIVTHACNNGIDDNVQSQVSSDHTGQHKNFHEMQLGAANLGLGNCNAILNEVYFSKLKKMLGSSCP